MIWWWIWWCLTVLQFVSVWMVNLGIIYSIFKYIYVFKKDSAFEPTQVVPFVIKVMFKLFFLSSQASITTVMTDPWVEDVLGANKINDSVPPFKWEFNFLYVLPFSHIIQNKPVTSTLISHYYIHPRVRVLQNYKEALHLGLREYPT